VKAKLNILSVENLKTLLDSCWNLVSASLYFFVSKYSNNRYVLSGYLYFSCQGVEFTTIQKLQVIV